MLSAYMIKVGVKRKTISSDDVLTGPLWAWQNIPHRLFRWAWIACGLVEAAEMAEFWGMAPEDRGFTHLYPYSICICIFIYREREREREMWLCVGP
jgi:hypothetical protein